MEQRSLRVVSTNKNFFTKLTNTISRLLIPTKLGINGIMISIKRSSLVKAFEAYKNETKDEAKKEILSKKYEDAYTLYLEAIDKYIMDSIYKKVKNSLHNTCKPCKIVVKYIIYGIFYKGDLYG